MKRILFVFLICVILVGLVSCMDTATAIVASDVADYCVANSCSRLQTYNHFLHKYNDEQQLLTVLDTIDWNEQAKNYLQNFLVSNTQGYSRRQLFDLLVIDNQFTAEECTNAINASQIDFYQQALSRAISYLFEQKIDSVRLDIIHDKLVENGFADEEIQYACLKVKNIVG